MTCIDHELYYYVIYVIALIFIVLVTKIAWTFNFVKMVHQGHSNGG